MNSLKDKLTKESKNISIELSEKEAEWLLGCLLDSYDMSEKRNDWNNGSILNKKEALKFFTKMFDTMSDKYAFIKDHNWDRSLTKNL